MLELTGPDRRKLREAVEIRSSLSGNLLTLIGLEEIKNRFPGLWEGRRDKILETAHTVVKQYSDPASDIVLPFGSDRFIVLFGKLTEEQAMIRSGLIKAEILKRFAGEDGLDDLDVGVEAMSLDSGEIKSGRLADLLQMAVAQAPAANGPVADPAGIVHSERARSLYRTTLSSLTDDKVGELATLEKQFGFNIEDLEFGFWPFLYTKRNAFSVFECTPVRSSATNQFLTGYEVLPRDADTALIAELDHMSLMRVRHGLVDMAMRKRTAVVVTPVAFDTLSSRSEASEYLKALETIPHDFREYLVIAVDRVPHGVPAGRFTELTAPLRRNCRAMTVAVSSPKHGIRHVKESGGFCATFDMGGIGKQEAVSPQLVKRLVEGTRRLGLQIAIKGLTSRAVLRGCRNLQVDYLAGPVLAELSDYVGPITEYRDMAA